ncbi:hypothetical protein T4B_14832 [Trichinella pseudospiralis]|uniref:Uncharacterized protein n=2 Tax=Trichinella pseudospiralis TaxID=6337 RepID=A0A0V1JAV6_TRIPS|nr:hypothetical protein T4D_5821 [Trichinella pseudospiralis]KRZ32079.1 hypothetical protein T4B_14832 [Trichinella pseudospiralis]
MDTVTNMHRTPDYFYILHFAIMNKSFILNKFAINPTTLNAKNFVQLTANSEINKLMIFCFYLTASTFHITRVIIMACENQFAYHQLGVSGDAVVDDEHLLAIFEVIFEGDGSAYSEAKFAEQGLRTAVDHVPTLPVHGHGYRPFGQTFGKTKTSASGADAEQHNLQIFRIRHKQRVHVGFQIFDQCENCLELFGMTTEIGISLLAYCTQLVQSTGDNFAGSTIAEHVRYGVAHATAYQLPVSGTSFFCSKLHRLVQRFIVDEVRQQKFQNLFQVFLFDQLQLKISLGKSKSTE